MASIEHRLHESGAESWRVVWREDGRRQYCTWDTEAGALQFKSKVEGYGNKWPPEDDPRKKVSPDGQTFREWALEAVGLRPKANVRTKADYRRDIENHFAVIADVPVAKLTQTHVGRWIEDRVAAGLAEKTIQNLHGLASSVMQDAVAAHPPVADHNPFVGQLGDIEATAAAEMVFMTPEEFETVHRLIRPEYQDFARLLADTGMRYGEATALLVRDVNLLGKRKTITVNKAWKRTGTKEYKVGEPKTAKGRRTIALHMSTVDMLVTHVSNRRGSELLFPSPQGGGQMKHSEFYKRGWAPAVARARVCDEHYEAQRNKRGTIKWQPDPCECLGVMEKKPTVHSIRHSHISWLIAKGVSLPVISRRVGHASIKVTMDTYGHLDGSEDDAIFAAFDDIKQSTPASPFAE